MPDDQNLFAYRDQWPDVDPTAWLASGARVVGNVTIGPEVGIFFNAVLRAEDASIEIGARSNVQDNCVVHAGTDHSVSIGEGVVIGHSAIVHGCRVDDDVLIGMGAVLLNDCHIGARSLVAAGALVSEGTVIPAGSLVVGRPGRVVRSLTVTEQKNITAGAEHYLGLLQSYSTGEGTVRPCEKANKPALELPAAAISSHTDPSE